MGDAQAGRCVLGCAKTVRELRQRVEEIEAELELVCAEEEAG